MLSLEIYTPRVVILAPHISMVGNRFDEFAMVIMVSICLSCASVLSGAGGAFFTFFSFLFVRLLETLDERVAAVASAGPLVVKALGIEGGCSGDGVVLVDRFDATFKVENARVECGESTFFLN